MFRYTSETTGLASISERACDIAPKNMLVRLTPVVRRERKAKKTPKMVPKNQKETASAFFISHAVMSVSDEQR